MGLLLGPVPDLAPPPCLVHEDPHLVVVLKPSGWNTHAPAPFAGEGLYDWLRNREPRWADLSILHRLDKDTSGLLVFGKTPEANRSLTAQFTAHSVVKRYRLWMDHRPSQDHWTTQSTLVRAGERYVSRGQAAEGEWAKTEFRLIGPQATPDGEKWELEATPHTGKTHQIRVHAADAGGPIVGDTLYGGRPFARLCLHAAELSFLHPEGDRPVHFQSPADFDQEPRARLRSAFIHPSETDAYRCFHGAADGTPGHYLDRLAEYYLLQFESAESPPLPLPANANLYRKRLRRDVRQTPLEESSPRHATGKVAPERFLIRENGVQFELSLAEGYSVGLFFDQRDNRRRLLTGHLGARFPLRPDTRHLQNAEVLNAFAYTCGFSVCAALAGARVTSLDLSRKYLDWGRRNFVHNGVDPAAHEFIYGDCFDWMRRLHKKQRLFEVILLDPPTFSRSKEQGDFRAEQDYGRLVQSALLLLKPGGVLFASTNAQRFPPEAFLEQVRGAVARSGRRILQELYLPQPPDFPVTRDEPAYLKTVWLRVQ